MANKKQAVNRSTLVYGYALGVFIANTLSTLSLKDLVFHEDVKAIYNKILLKHKIMVRKKDKQYLNGLSLGSVAYKKTCTLKDGTEFAVNASIRLLDMKNEGLLEKAFGIPSSHFISIKNNGVQDLTMDSVKLANSFLEELNILYDNYLEIKKAIK